jgi:hypothetical protein
MSRAPFIHCDSETWSVATGPAVHLGVKLAGVARPRAHDIAYMDRALRTRSRCPIAQTVKAAARVGSCCGHQFGVDETLRRSTLLYQAKQRTGPRDRQRDQAAADRVLVISRPISTGRNV